MTEGSVWAAMLRCSLLRFIYLAYFECMWYDLNDWRAGTHGEDKIPH